MKLHKMLKFTLVMQATVCRKIGLLPSLGAYQLVELSIKFTVGAVYIFLPSTILAAGFVYCPFMQEVFKCNITKLSL